MDFLSSAAHVVTRRRASSASATSSGLVQPPAPQHTNYLPPPQSLCAQFTTSMSNSDLGQQRERGSQVLSTSAPSLSPLFANQDPRQALSDGGSPASTESLPSTTTLSLEFEGGTHVIVRPNRIVRGKVIFEVAERTLATRLRIKFRGEESATVKVEEGGGDNRGKWVHQTITTFFDTDWKLWGSEVSAYSQASWDEFEPGHYEFPFALKFPNVNYPPSIEEPSGFAIRYIWTAQGDGPGLQSSLKSREFITPYRPILISTPDKEWVYKTTLKDKKHALAEVQAKLYKQTYCPDEHFEMQLNLTTLAADAKILAVNYKFQKHHEGKMLIQQGTAFREYIRNVLQGNIDIAKTNDPTQLSKTVRFDMPTRLVSPSYISRHTRVHYGLLFTITIEVGHIFKLNHTLEFNIPITIANLPYDHLVRVPELTAARDYRESDECPIFFDPVLDEPPSIAGISTSGMPMQSPPQNEEPPNYFALSDMPQQPGRKVRKERTVVLSRPAKGAFHAQGLIEALVIPGLFDEDW